MHEEYKTISKNIEAIVNESSKWLEKQKKIGKEMELLAFAFKEIKSAIPLAIEDLNGTYNDEFIPPWYYLVHEAEQELDSAKTLLMIGMYKDSLRSLRSFIELNLFAIHFFIKKDRKSFIEWLSGETETPPKSFLLREILENSDRIRDLDSKLKWKKEINILYRDLSKFVHTQGISGSFISLRKTNTHSFNENGLDYCIRCLERSINLVSQGLVANFTMTLQPVPMFEKFAFSGPAGGFLEEWQVENISKIFSERQLKVLKDISDNDEEAISLVEWVNSSKTLTKKEVLNSFNGAINNFPKNNKDELASMLKEGKTLEAFTMLTAMQKAFLGAITPVMNKIYLGIIRDDKEIKIIEEDVK